MIWKEEKTMREILFRGKRLDNGKWVEGFLVRTTLGSTIIVNEVEEYSCGCCIGIGSANFEVDPYTVGQYTGMKDKNGKRIFEGDIIQYYERQLDGKDTPVCDVVVYTEGGFAVKSYFLNNWLWDSVHGNIQLRDVEVIGNIHDNPELLKGGEG